MHLSQDIRTISASVLDYKGLSVSCYRTTVAVVTESAN